MTTQPLKIELIYSHDMPAVQLTGGTLAQHCKARAVVLNQWTNSPEYALARQARAFLQGQADGPFDLWTLIEFWKDDYGPFVDYLEKRLGVTCE